MSFNLDNQLLGEGEEFIAYDYYNMPVTGANLSPGVNPNLIFNNVDWIAKEIIFSNELHRISNADYDGDTRGEMIIVHQSIVNSNKKLALCIPLDIVNNDTPGLKNVITDIYTNYTGTTSTSYEINTIINPSKIIHYKTKIDSQALKSIFGDKLTVLVLAKPVQFYAAEFIPSTDVFIPITPTSTINDIQYSVIPAGSVKKISPDNIYIDCKPTGESKETIATYNVPINSEYTANASRLSFQEMVIQSIMFFTLLAISYVVVPLGFKSFGFQKIVTELLNDENSPLRKLQETHDTKYNNKEDFFNMFKGELVTYGTIVYLGLLGLIGVFLPLFLIGTTLNDSVMTSMSIYVAMFCAMSVFSIFLKLENESYRTVRTDKHKYELFYFNAIEEKKKVFEQYIKPIDYVWKGVSIFVETFKDVIKDSIAFNWTAILSLMLFIILYVLSNFETLPGTGSNPLYIYKNSNNDGDKAGVGMYFGFILYALIGGSYSFLKHIGVADE